MARLALLLVAVAVASNAAASTLGWPDKDPVRDQLIVTYSAIPDPFHKFSFFTMPRYLREADEFIFSYERPQDKTSVYCYEGDSRVCLLFDEKRSVAGIRLTISASQLEKTKAPNMDIANTPEWEHNWDPTAMEMAYSATVFFQSKEELLAGGRIYSEGDLIAPNGIYILQTDGEGQEVGRLHVPNEQSQVGETGFTEQACFPGMGKHYFQELSKESTCDKHRPYFLLFGPQSKKLNGFGFTMYGKANTDGRSWFESPPAIVAKMIAPHSPDCLYNYVKTYGMFTLHVYFVARPYQTLC